MKPSTVIGIILVVVGVIGFLTGGLTFTHQKKDIDMGPIQVSHEQKKTVLIPPAISAVCLVAGIGLVAVGAVRSKA
jgi:hypothetical protein